LPHFAVQKDPSTLNGVSKGEGDSEKVIPTPQIVSVGPDVIWALSGVWSNPEEACQRRSIYSASSFHFSLELLLEASGDNPLGLITL
jgi:hypothetical protein